MNRNRMKLNPKKTEFIIFGSSTQLGKCAMEQINVCGTEVKKCELTCYLGAWLNATLNFKHYTNIKCHTALANVKKIWLIRNLLDRESCEILICSLILCHLNYSNGILAGAADLVINKLQRGQHFATQVTLNQNKNYRSIKALFELHWLPVRAHIDFKILLITHKYLNDSNSPSYLQNLLVHNKRSGMYPNLRSNDSNDYLLIIPCVKQKHLQYIHQFLWTQTLE